MHIPRHTQLEKEKKKKEKKKERKKKMIFCSLTHLKIKRW